VIVHDVKTLKVCDIFLHENAVLCISVHPNQSQIFATACESGELSLYDLRISNTTPIILATTSSTLRSLSSSSSYSYTRYMGGGAFNSCSFNPIEPNLIVAANEVSGVSLVDIRMKKTVMRYKTTSSSTANNKDASVGSVRKFTEFKQNVMSVRFNSNGTHIAALRSKLRPVLYALNEITPAYVFDHEEFNNACTLKSCCFAGDQDQYFVSGSDDFSVYIWKIPELLPYNVEKASGSEKVIEDGDESENDQFQFGAGRLNFSNSSFKSSSANLISDAHLKLSGHRSIVNQCRYNKNFHLLATSGIEKIIKIWAPYKMPGNCRGGLKGTPNEFTPKRKLYTYRDLFSFRHGNNSQTNSANTANNPESTTENYNNTSINQNDENSISISSSLLTADSNDLAISNYEPVIRNRYDTEANESLEEDKIMMAFFDSQVRRRQLIQDNQSRRRKFKRARLSSHEEEDNSLSTIEEDFYYETDTELNSINSSRKKTTTSSTLSDSDNEVTTDSDNSGGGSSDSSSDDLRTAVEKASSKESLRNETFSSSSSSSSSSNDEYSQILDDEADINVDELLKKASSSGEKKNLFDLNLDLINEKINENSKKQRTRSISLRDRIRNLRHRQTLNLIQQTDYVNVLNSLSVSNNTNEPAEGAQSQTIVVQDKEKDIRVNLFEDNNNTIESLESAQVAGFRLSHLENSEEKLEIDETKASGSSKRDLIKSLNEQKRKIEKDQDENELVKQNFDNDESSLNNTINSSSFFKRKKSTSCKNNRFKK
jgi:DDB1- and CUL4-associated factor 5